MASIRLEAPSPFDFKAPDEWPRWKRRFQQYRQASGLSEENQARQVSTLLYCLGENAEETLASTTIEEAHRDDYEKVMEAFDAFYQVRKNVIFERACFNGRVQREGESVEQFITSLYSLAENCAYGELANEMIRDRIVVGIRDKALSERLQLDSELTLDSAKRKVRQREAIHEQQTVLRRPGSIKEEKSLDALKRFNKRPQHHVSSSASKGKCTRCGKSQHERSQCPAREATCYKCSKKGHFASACRSKKAVASLEERSEDLEIAYLNTVCYNQGTSWRAKVKVNGQEMSFKLDTGAEVTAISEKVFASLGKIQLREPEKVLCGPDRQKLDVVGCVSVKISYDRRTTSQCVYVIRKLKNNLLGLPAIQSLHLLKKVDEVEVLSTSSVKEKFPRLFQGLGTLKGEYEIKLKPDAKPFAQPTARNVPLPLRKKVKEEIARKEALGVITKVQVDDSSSVTSSKEREVEAFVDSVVASLPASKDRLEVYKRAQMEDPLCSQVVAFCHKGWPQAKTGPALQPYRLVQSELTCLHGLLMYRNRIVVPESLRRETLEKIHQGHQGVVRCKLRAGESVWWPGVNRDVEKYIKECPQCAKSLSPSKEPLMSTPLPSHPWERVAADLFQLKGLSYLVVVDYYSRYPEVIRLGDTTSSSIVRTLKSVFSRHGIPTVFVSDNGPQFASAEMTQFASQYTFRHITSSPRYPQSNGLAERTVKTVKSIIQDAPDPYMALLSYRTTPLPFCNLSPTELLMGRKLRTDVPTIPSQLIPKWSYLEKFRHDDSKFKSQQSHNYNRRHRVRTLPELPAETEVWVRSGNAQSSGRILTSASTPRSYLVSTPGTTLRRNRSHVIPKPPENPPESPPPMETPRIIMTRSRTGAELRRPERLNYLKRGGVV